MTILFAVFRVKTIDGNYKFVDCEGDVYKTWNEFLLRNEAPQGIICYPKEGLLRKQEGNGFVANDVEFCEPVSCKTENTTRDKFDLGTGGYPVLYQLDYFFGDRRSSRVTTAGLFYCSLAM